MQKTPVRILERMLSDTASERRRSCWWVVERREKGRWFNKRLFIMIIWSPINPGLLK